ncbi:MAG TPA: histidine phosphatase family protein [Sulfuricurvum sp.]|nr:MAG: hypothetical protein B7Y30_00045 [Campylobacterales bacterium 16-40-21]OZA03137.1 MAG: hypothetical protein B7X89_05910 [Sulfuricurvum sp. 17-40-25]HQS67057.1 histidine phosphatase family protein [Sulfuricurvum sp.]HQT35997.1 histidine phosphatase family protein [Sulfuricurvum sp.]
MELTLLRHAPPHQEYYGCYNGHTDIPIDIACFEHAKIQPLLHHQFDRIYSSDLQRCTATLEAMGVTAFIADARLREVRFKPSIEGKTFAQIEGQEDFNSRYLDSKESWHKYICDESFEIFQARIQSFLDELPKDKNILICSHGGTISMVLSLLNTTIENNSLKYLDHITVSLR